MNRINLTGRLTRDPELRALPSGESVVELRLAVDGAARNNRSGYFDVVSYGNGATAAGRTLTRGWLVAVDGRLEHREWEQDGQKRSAVCVVGHIEFLAAPRGVDGEMAGVRASSAHPDDDIPF